MSKIIKAILNPNLAIKYIYHNLYEYIRKRKQEKWAKNDSLSINDNEKVLFVDLGVNLGQAYKFFKKYFNASNISFELFEPNPNCLEHLKKLDDVMSGKTKLHPVGVGVSDGLFEFYGLCDDEGGKYSQGGSIVKEHNSKYYKNSPSKGIKVNIIKFSSYLINKSKEFDKIIVKMDIEGAEVDLLESLIKEKTINLIYTLYVEFHSHYQRDDMFASIKRREEKILYDLSNRTSVNVRIWR